MPQENQGNNLIATARPTAMGGLVNLGTTPANLETVQGDKVLVILARSGVGAKKYAMPKGSTMEDLCLVAEADHKNQDIRIGQTQIDMNYVFTKPELVFMVSKPKNA